MELRLNIIQLPDGITGIDAQKVFGESGGTIGRADTNDWILPDPEKYISSCHCKIQYEDNQYYLIDSSTNGTFTGAEKELIGAGNRVPVSDLMRIVVGDYEIQAQLVTNQASQNNQDGAGRFGPFADLENSAPPPPSDLLTEPANNQILQDDGSQGAGLFLPGADQNALLSDQEGVLDPIEALDKANNQAASPGLVDDSHLFHGQGDNAPPVDQAFNPPGMVPHDKIPEDWDHTEMGYLSRKEASESNSLLESPIIPVESKPVKSQIRPKPTVKGTPVKKPVKQRTGELQGTVKKKAAVKKPKQQQPTANHEQTAAVSQPPSKDLLGALGIDAQGLSQQQISVLNQLTGTFVRQTIDGLLQVLRARNMIKNELRLSVTTVQPTDNNPLKFAATVDEAIEHLFVRQGKAYMPPIQSVRESFDSLADNQVAILAGMRAAFAKVMKNFDPVELSSQFDMQSGGGLFGAGKKIRYWDSYLEYYRNLTKESESAFQLLFGEEFIKAYEGQILKLEFARKKTKGKTK